MEHSNVSPGPGTHSMLDILDQAFLRHFQRITGSPTGIHGLSMDLVTVACIVLLAERPHGAGDSEETEAHSRADLEQELEEMGLEDSVRLEHTLEDMTGKGYLKTDDERSRLVPEKATLSMAGLLERAFPGMPGMNLVAYFVQTLDEVETGRKQPKQALSQLDQMLRRHGAAPFGNRPGSKQTHPSPSIKKPRPTLPGRPSARRPSRLRAPVPKGVTPPPRLKPEEEAPPLHEPPPPEAEKALNTPPSNPSADRGIPEQADEAPVNVDGPAQSSSPSMIPNDHVETDHAEPEPPFQPHSKHLEPVDSEPLDLEPVPDTPPSPPEPQDDPDDRIAAFEQELSMQCPVCKEASVEVQQTAKGRTYYKCRNDACMFISWGRPHHIPCPWCGNGFLVETSHEGEPLALRCPRATCRYRGTSPEQGATPEAPAAEAAQPPSQGPKPRRRVVRRKKVRRKKRHSP